MTLKQQINAIIRAKLQENANNINKTARDLGVSVRMIRYKVRQYEREALCEHNKRD